MVLLRWELLNCEMLNMPFSMSFSTWYDGAALNNAHKEVVQVQLTINRAEARKQAMEEEEGITDANNQTVITIPLELLRGKPNSTMTSGGCYIWSWAFGEIEPAMNPTGRERQSRPRKDFGHIHFNIFLPAYCVVSEKLT